MAKKRRRNKYSRSFHKQPPLRQTPTDELLERVDYYAETIDQELQAVLPLLSKIKADRLPGTARDLADIDITATRLGRMLQLLRGSRTLVRLYLGTAIAPVVRSMWETWFNTAWMLHDPQQRMQRATDFWVSGVAQQLGMLHTFLVRDGYLVPAYQEAMNDLEKTVKGEPHLYERWFNEHAQPRRSVHAIQWPVDNFRERAQQMGPMYERSYDLDYTLLSIASHGASAELPRLMEENPEGTRIFVGEGRDAAINYFLIGCGTALTLIYEIQHAYLGGHTPRFDTLREQGEKLREECPSIL